MTALNVFYICICMIMCALMAYMVWNDKYRIWRYKVKVHNIQPHGDCYFKLQIHWLCEDLDNDPLKLDVIASTQGVILDVPEDVYIPFYIEDLVMKKIKAYVRDTTVTPEQKRKMDLRKRYDSITHTLRPKDSVH